jgi:hypothetical protein
MNVEHFTVEDYMKSTLGTLTAMVAMLPAFSGPFFYLGSRGAVNLVVQSDEARYGVSKGEEGPRLTIMLGVRRSQGALALSLVGGRSLQIGKYRVRPSGKRLSAEPQFQALYVPGAPNRPLGAFRAESGSVTITREEAGWIAGEFEIEARGFVAGQPDNEDQWVTVRGRFEAQGDSTLVASRSASK